MLDLDSQLAYSWRNTNQQQQLIMITSRQGSSLRSMSNGTTSVLGGRAARGTALVTGGAAAVADAASGGGSSTSGAHWVNSCERSGVPALLLLLLELRWRGDAPQRAAFRLAVRYDARRSLRDTIRPAPGGGAEAAPELALASRLLRRPNSEAGSSDWWPLAPSEFVRSKGAAVEARGEPVPGCAAVAGLISITVAWAELEGARDRAEG